MNNNNNWIGYDGIVNGMIDCWNNISLLKQNCCMIKTGVV